MPAPRWQTSRIAPQSIINNRQPTIHPALEAIRLATIGTPYEGRLWLVGGAVRDELLGRAVSNDFDIVLETPAEDLARFLFERRISSIAPVTYPRFGTALAHVQGVNIELATARKESYADESRKPEVEPATLEEDARRRDFTVNALLRNLHSGELYDPLGSGLADMEAKVLRTPLDPQATFYDDPLRMLRAVRFRWQLGFDPVTGLYESIAQEAHRLQIISAERIRDEVVKMLILEEADRSLEDLRALGLLKVFAPELDAMKGVEQGHFHHLDVWDHTLLVVRNVGLGDLALTLAALLHDVGKPQTRFIDEEGHTRFFGHEGLGADIARGLLRRLKFSNEQIEPVVRLVKSHMRLGSSPTFTAAAARRLIRDLGDDVDRLLKLVEADANALRPGVKKLDLGPIQERIEEASLATPRHQLESPLSGKEIMEITGLPAGPEIGKLKEMLVEKVLEGELGPGDKEGAARLIRRSP
ncbi:MAG: HDIG domain-containing metalloprotein [Fimbriimonadaceae bacterium]